MSTTHIVILYFFFFFSSRRRHTRLQGDWSSDVCSSDLRVRPDNANATAAERVSNQRLCRFRGVSLALIIGHHSVGNLNHAVHRSEERRVGKECRSRWSPYH